MLYLTELQPLARGWQESNLRPFPKREEISSFTTGLTIFRLIVWGCAVARSPEYRVNVGVGFSFNEVTTFFATGIAAQQRSPSFQEVRGSRPACVAATT